MLVLTVAACGDDAPSTDASAPDADGSAVHDGQVDEGSAGAAGSAGRGGDGAGSGSGDGDGDGDRDGSADERDGAVDESGDGGRDAGGAEPLALAEIAVGYNHACAIDEAGALHCWGDNALGQLGLGDQQARERPTRVGERADWLAVSAGRFHTCGVRALGVLECWGGGAFGQVGAVQQAVLTPSPVAAPSGAWRSVSAGQWHTCALTDAGQIYCWGYSSLGRLGDGTGAGSEEDPALSVAAPVRVSSARTFKAVSAGAAHSCALDEAGALLCWGSGEDGRLGVAAPDGCALADSSVPCALEPEPLEPLPEGRAYSAVSAGGAHACALEASGALWCWGRGEYGQLGIGEPGDPPARSTPVEVGGAYAAVSCGSGHTCAITGEGALVCFGDGSNGQLASSATGALEPAPADLEGPMARLSSGTLGGCAVTESSLGFCWGSSAYAGASPGDPLF